jgi:hypothetical protein
VSSKIRTFSKQSGAWGRRGSWRSSYDASAQVAQSIGITIHALGMRAPDDFNEGFTAMDKEPPDAILMVADSLTTLNRKRVFDFAAQRRLPAIYEYDVLVRDGGMMSYGADLTESFERAGRPGRPHPQGPIRPSGRSSSRSATPSS